MAKHGSYRGSHQSVFKIIGFITLFSHCFFFFLHSPAQNVISCVVIQNFCQIMQCCKYKVISWFQPATLHVPGMVVSVLYLQLTLNNTGFRGTHSHAVKNLHIIFESSKTQLSLSIYGGISARMPDDTKTHARGCSSPLYKMT